MRPGELPPGRTAVCPVCGKAVDALRAPRVRYFGSSCLTFCSQAHAASYRHQPGAAPGPGPDAPGPAPGAPEGHIQPSLPLPAQAPPWSGEPTQAEEPPLLTASHGAQASSPTSDSPGVPAPLAPSPTNPAANPAAKPPTNPAAWARLKTLAAYGPSTLAALSALGAFTSRDPTSESQGLGPYLSSLIVLLVLAVVSSTLAKRLAAPSRALQANLRQTLASDARRVRGDALELVGAGALRAGDEIEVRPGEVVLADGIVSEGQATVRLYPAALATHQATTGTRLPTGSQLIAGQVRLVCAMASQDRPLESLVDEGPQGAELAPLPAKFGGQLKTHGAKALALVAAVIAGTISGDVWFALLAFGSVWGALSHPLVDALPRTVTRRALFELAKSGVHLKPEAIQKAAHVSACVLCARGTVLSGEPEISEIHALRDATEEEVLALAAGAESVVEHPVATSILAAAHRRGVGPEQTRSHDVALGLGVVCLSASGAPLVVGSRELLLRERISIASSEELLRKIESRGQSGILVARDGHLIGLLSLSDALRPGARAAVQLLLDEHIEPVLLSGDARKTTEAVAHALSIDHFRPEIPARKRAQEVEGLTHGGAHVAAIGHSPLDDAALFAATVPIVLDGASVFDRRRGVCVLDSDLRLAAQTLITCRHIHRATERVLVLCAGPAAIGAALSASLLFPPVIAPLLALISGCLAAFFVYRLPSDCSSRRAYGTPGK